MKSGAWGVLLLAGALAGCTSYGPGGISPGQTEAEVIRSMGTPTERSVLPSQGTRLEFARGPMGRHTYRVDLDSEGRVVGVAQVLTEQNFALVRPGDTAESVRQRLGRPSEQSMAYGNRQLWSYRYENVFCQWFVVTIEPDGRVREAAHLKDPQCSERGEPLVVP